MENNFDIEAEWQYLSPRTRREIESRHEDKRGDNTPEDAHLDAHAEMDCGE